MALPLYERALGDDSETLVRLTEHGLSVEPPDPPASLIPNRGLQPGEQYRFHFNMPRCIGCRSCEVACNEQNGNPAQIQWRRVGEIEGGSYPNTFRHFLSMSCNHCLNAECLKGCPVNAYTKDPKTGIVLHSAEACIGCQYCVWNCPYAVPQFNPERGVVGKCDMCKGRLEEALEPACVNACPESAIEIEIVNVAEWRADFAAAESPGMPTAEHTLSTTRITVSETGTALERVDAGHIRPEHGHPSLVLMTTMMQGVTGALTFLCVYGVPAARELATLLCATILALTASSMHLGRPAYAWRALRMWKRSWLSREVLLFTVFFALLAAATTIAVLSPKSAFFGAIVGLLCWIACIVGALATIASAFIYLVPARPSWNTVHTPIDFALSAALLGGAGFAILDPGRVGLTIAIATAWVANQALRLHRLRNSTSFEERASYSLQVSDLLLPYTVAAVLSLGVGLVALSAGHPALAVFLIWGATLIARYLFFVSVVPLKVALTFLAGGAA